MKFTSVTRTILKGAARLHSFALNEQTKAEHRRADKQFDRAAKQLELVNAAKAHLNELQNAAIEQRGIARSAAAYALDELRTRVDRL